MNFTCLVELSKCESNEIIEAHNSRPVCPNCGHPMAEVIDLRKIDFAVGGYEFARARDKSSRTIADWYRDGLHFLSWYGSMHLINIRDAKIFEKDDGRGKSSK